MYYTGIDPFSGNRVYVADEHEKRLQRALLQPTRPENAPLVREALRRIGRDDLIGYDKDCLIRPAKEDLGQGGGKNGGKAGRPSGRPFGSKSGPAGRQSGGGNKRTEPSKGRGKHSNGSKNTVRKSGGPGRGKR